MQGNIQQFQLHTRLNHIRAVSDKRIIGSIVSVYEINGRSRFRECEIR